MPSRGGWNYFFYIYSTFLFLFTDSLTHWHSLFKNITIETKTMTSHPPLSLPLFHPPLSLNFHSWPTPLNNEESEQSEGSTSNVSKPDERSFSFGENLRTTATQRIDLSEDEEVTILNIIFEWFFLFLCLQHSADSLRFLFEFALFGFIVLLEKHLPGEAKLRWKTGGNEERLQKVYEGQQQQQQQQQQ